MIIVMKPEATVEDLNAVKDKIKNSGLDYHLSQGSSRVIVGVIGDKKKIATLQMNSFSGVEKTVSITEKYKLVQTVYEYVFGRDTEEYFKEADISRNLKEICINACNGLRL